MATQGPLSNTIADFWAMIWQEESQIILMMTHEEEKGREKCFRYWPNMSQDQDQEEAIENSFLILNDLRINFLNLKIICDDYLVREFLVVNLKTDERRKIYQFQYLAWSDHGVPDNVQNTLDFIENFNRLYKDLYEINSASKARTHKPITVHCSAGIGRTGAIILIDMMLDKIKTCGIQSDIDIYKTVCSLRAQRSGMIQTEKQYQFLYLAIRHFIQSFNRNIANDSNRLLNNMDYINTSTPRTSSLQSIISPNSL